MFVSRALAVVALACGQAMFGQASPPATFNPAYGPAPDATRKKIVVTTTSDAINGDVSSWNALVANPGSDGISLREALTVANLTAGPKEIDFAPALKGSTVRVASVVKEPLPFLTSGDLVLNGDVDADGQPDVTFDGTDGGNGPSSLGVIVWSSRNHINGLRFQNFLANSLMLSPPESATLKTVADNRFTNNWIDAQRGGQAAFSMGPFGMTTASTINDVTWANTTIAGNTFISPLFSVQVQNGVGAARNHYAGVIVKDNVMTNTGISVNCGDANSSYVGDFVPRLPPPVIYSDYCTAQDIQIINNQFVNTSVCAISIQAGDDGNSHNRVSNVTIAGNTIAASTTPGQPGLWQGIIVTSCSAMMGPRFCQDDVVENVVIKNNRLEGAEIGITVGVAGTLNGWLPGDQSSRMSQVTVSDNIVSDFIYAGIQVFGATNSTAQELVTDNHLSGVTVLNNQLSTTQRGATTGIFAWGGTSVDKGMNVFTGPCRQNSIDSLTIIGNRVRGCAASIKVLGGYGSGAIGNHITGLLLSGNDVDLPPIVAANDLGASGNTVEVLPSLSRLINLSTRGLIQAGGTLTPGFVMRGTGSKRVVIRGIGPTLATFGLGAPLADPKLDVFAQGGAATSIIANDDWGGSVSLSNACTGVGAFPLDPASKDSAVEASLAVNGSGYTVRIAPNEATSSGIALAEVYDADALDAPVRLINVSTLGFAGTGENVITAGFVVGGTGTKSLLIRAVGPGLAQFGVTGWLADPQLQVIPAGQSTAVASNDDWGGTAALKSAFTTAGAFVLPDASKDAAVFVCLPPGGYTVVISGAGTTTGTALIEVYDLDP